MVEPAGGILGQEGGDDEVVGDDLDIIPVGEKFGDFQRGRAGVQVDDGVRRDQPGGDAADGGLSAC